MIQTELLNDGTLIRHYSDAGIKIMQVETGIVYGEAIDLVPCAYTYVETDEPEDTEEMEEMTETEEKAMAYDIVTGVVE